MRGINYLIGATVLLCVGMASALAEEAHSLQTIMKQLGQDMNQLNNAIFAEDFAAMERHAEAIAEHPKPPMGERVRILSRMGEDAPRFRAADQQVHDAAQAVGAAAGDEDMIQVLHFYHRLMQGCVDCHTEFRPRLVD